MKSKLQIYKTSVLPWVKLPFSRNTIAYLLIGLFSIISAVYNHFLPLHPDEAYYWLWSKHLATGYYDHPPMVAYLLWLTTLFGNNEFSVRLAAVLTTAITAIYLFRLAKETFDEQVALLALFSFLLLPLTNMAATIITPDAPLSMFWGMSLFYGYRAISREKTVDFLLSGASVGLALMSKYTAVLLPVILILFLLIKRRNLLFCRRTWLAIFLAFFIFLPVVWWNWQNNWISFVFQYRHGSANDFVLNYRAIREFIGGLFLLMSPVFMGILLVGLFRFKEYTRDEKRFFVVLSFLVVTLFFFYKGLFKRMSLNWYAPAVFAGIIYFAYITIRYGYWKTYWVGAIITVILTLGIRAPQLMFLPPEANIINRLFGYKEAAIRFGTHIKDPEALLFTDYLTTASILHFYLPNQPTIYEPFSDRMSMFKIWQKGVDISGRRCYIFFDDEDDIQKYKNQYSNLHLIEKYTVSKKGYLPKTFYFYWCDGLNYIR